MRIVFMGTPEFAVPSLEILLNNGFNVVGVITSTDKLGGRGKKQLLQSAVKKCALKHGLRILQPSNLKAPEFIEELRSLQADLQIVVAFRMLPEVVWNMPPLGTYNLHGSLLPSYRGAAPINWAIIHGETQTGVTTFKLKHQIDTGNIAYQEAISITPTDNAGDVHDKLMITGAQLVLKTVKAIQDETIELHPQDDTRVTKAPKIYHDDCQLSPEASIVQVYNKMRGLSPYPAAWVPFGDKKLKIFKATYSFELHDYKPGTFVSDSKHVLRWYVSDGYLELTHVQCSGRKRMNVRDFLNGTNLPDDTKELK